MKTYKDYSLITEAKVDIKLKSGSKIVYGGWTNFIAKINGNLYAIEAKIFEEPSHFGIDNGKISKLWIYPPKNTGEKEINYDRGWDSKPPKSGDIRKVYDEFVKRYN